MTAMTAAPLPTIPRIFTAVAQWLSCLLYIRLYFKQHRVKGWHLALACAFGFFLLAVELTLTGSVAINFWLVSMIGSCAIMYGVIICCCDIPPADAGNCLVRGFTLSEFAASLSWQLIYFYSDSRNLSVWSLWDTVSVLGVYAAIYLIALQVERTLCDEGVCEPIGKKELIAAAVIGMVVFAMSNLSFVEGNSPFTSSQTREIYNIRTLIDFAGIAILYAFNIQHRQLRMRFERDAIQNVLETQYAQYRQSRESIDLINRKYHDLKHQIAALRAESDPNRRSQWLDAMESDIAVYEAQNKTGNSVLDTVLTGKSLYCQKHGINLTTVADGEPLKFMDPMDICTVFGNALDNAIESVLELPDKEKRLIHLSVSVRKQFLLIQVENFFQGKLEFHNGNPKTTKGDERFHGFGVKSIRYSVARYGGTVSIETPRDWFVLRVLIPLPEGKNDSKTEQS